MSGATTDPLRRWITVPEFAAYLGVSSVHAYRLVALEDAPVVADRLGAGGAQFGRLGLEPAVDGPGGERDLLVVADQVLPGALAEGFGLRLERAAGGAGALVDFPLDRDAEAPVAAGAARDRVERALAVAPHRAQSTPAGGAP